MVRQVGVRPLLAASLSVTDASEWITDLSLIQALAQPTLPVPCPALPICVENPFRLNEQF